MAFRMSFNCIGLGKRFLILGFKNKSILSIFFFLIDKSLATISVSEYFSIKSLTSDDLNFL